MYFETSYPGYLGDLSGNVFQSILSSGTFTGTKAQWKQAGKPGYTPPISSPAAPPSIGAGSTTIPTTEPNQCPPGMTYSAPPPGSGTGTCSGSIIPGGATDGSQPTSSGSITDMLSSISPTVWLIVAGLALFLVLRK